MCKYYRLILVVTVLLLYSCDSKPDLSKSGGGSEPVSIEYLKSLYSVAPVTIDKEIIIEGRIVSNDIYGNFYKLLYLEDETGGIAIRIDMEDIFKTYRYGYKARVNCNSLTLGNYGGALQLGVKSYLSQYEVEPIGTGKISSHISIDLSSAAEPMPSLLEFSEMAPRYINCYVKFENVAFIEEEKGLLWGEDGENTERHLVNEFGDTLTVRTSAYSIFSGYLLPAGRGTIQGILGYFNRNYQLIMISPHHAIFESEIL